MCCFICVTLLWALHIVIKQQFFKHLYLQFFSTKFKMQTLTAISAE